MSSIIPTRAMSRLSPAASGAFTEAVLAELDERCPFPRGRIDHAMVATITEEMLPFWAEWDARGGFAPEADHAALWAAWEREEAATR